MYYLHAYARGVDKRDTFLDPIDYKTFLLALTLSVRPNAPSASIYLDWLTRGLVPGNLTASKIKSLFGQPNLTIISAVLMPNHFHIQLSQDKPEKAGRFFRRLITSYTKYFNARYQREGHLFSSKVKTVGFANDEQNVAIQAGNWIIEDNDTVRRHSTLSLASF